MTTYIKQAQSGRSMIEMLGVLAIIGVLSAGGIAGYSMAMSSYKANNLMDQVQMISTQARILYNGTYENNEDILAKLVALKYVGESKNPFNSAGTALTATGKGSTFEVAATDIPKDACVKYLTSSWGDSSIFANIGAQADKAATSWSVSDAVGTNGCTADANTVTWTFK